MDTKKLVEALQLQLQQTENYLGSCESTWRYSGLLDLPAYRLAASLEGSFLSALAAATCLHERLVQLKSEGGRQ